MRIAHLLMIVTAAAAAMIGASLGGCDQQSSNDTPPPPVTHTSSRSPGAAHLPTTDEVFGKMPTTNESSTTQRSFAGPATSTSATTTATTAASGSAAGDPLATPSAAVTHMFELMQKEDALGVRAMMVDPSVPLNKLHAEISAVADRVRSGATWQIVEEHTEGEASMVIFRTRFPDGRNEISPLLLVNRYEHWKVLLGPVNMKKFTVGEKESMTKVSNWATKRMQELRGTPSTSPATTRTTTTS